MNRSNGPDDAEKTEKPKKKKPPENKDDNADGSRRIDDA